MTVPNYAHLLVEARACLSRGDSEMTLPTSLVVDLLQRVCSPLAPSTRHPYPLPNPHADNSVPSAAKPKPDPWKPR